MPRETALLYITFDIGENAGNLLDYFKKHCPDFYHLSIYLHDLPHHGQNQLLYYQEGQRVRRQTFWTPTQNIPLIYLNILRMVRIALRQIPHPTEIASMNPYFLCLTACLRRAQVRKKYFIVGDCPYTVTDAGARNFILKKFYGWAIQISDQIWFVTQTLYHNTPQKLLNGKRIFVHPFGLERKFSPANYSPTKKYDLVYIGNFSEEKLGHFYEFLQRYPQRFKSLLIGTGELQSKLEAIANRNPFITLIGPVYKDKPRAKKLKSARVGIALFKHTNSVYYGDPVKIKLYLQHGLPVITDKSPEIAQDIDQYQSGVVLPDPTDQKNFIEAVNRIINNYSTYQENVTRLCAKYDYRKINNQFFEHLS